MRVEYKVETLTGMEEVQLAGVPFETADLCPVCGSRELIDVAQLRDSLISARCRACAHMFHRRRPVSDWYSGWYRSSWDGARDRQAEPGATPLPGARLLALLDGRARSAVRALLPNDAYRPSRELFQFCKAVVSPGDRVLDVGCGYGGYLLPFIEYGCSGFGIEASPHRARAAARRGIRAINIPVESLDASSFSTKFQLVSSNHVFEHVYDPHAFLSAVTRVLEPGGWLCLTVPNQETDFLLQQFFFALHLHCFSGSSLAAVLRRHGFVPHRVLHEHQIRVLARYQPQSVETSLMASPPDHEPLVDFVVRLTLGEQYERLHDRASYCRWKASLNPTRCGYDINFTDERPLPGERAVRLSWSGDKGLPIQIVRAEAPDQAVPFWAK
jgi:SAM-dependent methyltransferase